MFLSHRPTAAEERAMRRRAARWQAEARHSARADAQADLPRGQREVFQLKIVLEGSKPPIWRRVLVPAGLRLPDLHGVIQLAMGWQDAHLYRFLAGGRQEGVQVFGDPRQLEIDLALLADGCFIDDLHVPLDHLLVNVHDWIRYEYDLGDGWMHRLTLEDIHVRPLREARIPRCIAGRRACPPENVGGMLGYEDALALLADPSDPEHGELLQFLGPAFDPEHWDPARVNAELQAAFAPSSNP